MALTSPPLVIDAAAPRKRPIPEPEFLGPQPLASVTGEDRIPLNFESDGNQGAESSATSRSPLRLC